jgi:muramoyltetrapeptide carboxypeptidase
MRLATCIMPLPTIRSRAIFCTRGGYGSNYLLDGLDLDLIAESAKPFIAYSDLTACNCGCSTSLACPPFMAPCSRRILRVEDGVHLPSLQAALAGKPYSVGAPRACAPCTPAARGTLYGGCLSILVSLLGTPYEPQTEGKLLFLEDVGAKPYQIDRMLWQLRQAGKLEGVRGIVFGEMLDCVSPGAPPDLLER